MLLDFFGKMNKTDYLDKILETITRHFRKQNFLVNGHTFTIYLH